jgi:KDO2-lipid IV(A) lauroyltransferase
VAKRIKHRLEYALVRGGFALGKLLPWSWISGFGAGLGRFAFHVLRVRRALVLRNLRIAFGDELDADERRRIAGRCYAQFGRSYLEYFALPGWRRRRMVERIDFEGWEYMEAALAKGKGIVFLASHYGNWEMMALAALSRGLRVHVVVGYMSNEAVHEAVIAMRRDLGLPVHHRERGLRNLLKALRDGEGIGILGDQEARSHGVPVSYFGRESLTHPGPAFLSIKTGAPIVPSYLVREGGRFRMVFRDPIDPGEARPSESTDERIARLTAAHTRVLEEMVRRHPDHWFWMHDRWKLAPRGEDGEPRRLGPD